MITCFRGKSAGIKNIKCLCCIPVPLRETVAHVFLDKISDSYA